MDTPFHKIQAIEMKEQLNSFLRQVELLEFTFSNPLGQLETSSDDSLHETKVFSEHLTICREIRSRMRRLAENVPLIQKFTFPGLHARHWKKISEAVRYEISPEVTGYPMTVSFSLHFRLG